MEIIDRQKVEKWVEDNKHNQARSKYFGNQVVIYHRGEVWLIIKESYDRYEVRHGHGWGKLHTHHQRYTKTLNQALNGAIKTHRPELRPHYDKVFKMKELLTQI